MSTQEKNEIREILISRIIKSEDLNHHGTLFAGRMAEWLVEACLISTIDLLRKPEDIVCATGSLFVVAEAIRRFQETGFSNSERGRLSDVMQHPH